jgi:hypothetical protein
MSGGACTGGKPSLVAPGGGLCAPAAAMNPIASTLANSRFMTHLLRVISSIANADAPRMTPPAGFDCRLALVHPAADAGVPARARASVSSTAMLSGLRGVHRIDVARRQRVRRRAHLQIVGGWPKVGTPF